MPEHAEQGDRSKSQLGWQWPLASGTGAMVGAGLALVLFPGAAFAQNPTGEFGWHLVGFAFLVGISFSLAQWSILRNLARQYLGAKPLIVWLWIPLSAIAIMWMLIPLWWVSADYLFWVPWLALSKMFPGMLILGIFQRLILRSITAIGFKWVFLTVLGAAIGATVGLFASFALPVVPIEMSWAFITGGSIGLLQAYELAAIIDAAAERANKE